MRPEAFKLAPEFAYLDEKDMLCIILAYDHHSMYRQFPEDIRKQRARVHVFSMSNEDFFEKEKILKAVDAFKRLQYNSRVNQIITMKKALDNETKRLENLGEDDGKKLKEILSNSKLLRAAITEIEEELDREEEQEAEAEKQGIKTTFLEQLVTNPQRYKEVTQKRH